MLLWADLNEARDPQYHRRSLQFLRSKWDAGVSKPHRIDQVH
jgi:hypothetical protein